jgi:glycosyltransferase involved in cell wall biosynthesis
MHIPISVILCTHNPRSDYLRRTLEALRAQTISLQKWELLLVDNASSEVLADTWDISWHPRGRHVREQELGTTFARIRGIKESLGESLVFVDDDNVLALDYLEQAEAISARYPYLGVFGAGRLEGDFEVPPPQELLSRLELIAVRSVRSVMWSNNVKDWRSIPWGPGLWVSREIANRYQHLVESLKCTAVLDRRGLRLFAGEDVLFAWASVAARKGFGLFPELRVTHLTRAARLNRRYFVRLIHDHACSHAVLRYSLAGVPQRRIPWVEYLRLPFHGIKNGEFSMRCRWAALRGEDSAHRFIDENGLRPLKWDAGVSQPGLSADPRQSMEEARS